MAFNQGRRIPGNRHAFNHVGIKRPLGQKLRTLPHFLGCLVEHVNKFPPDDLPLSLRIRHTTQPLQKSFSGINHRQVEMPVFTKYPFHALHLILSQEPVIDKDAAQAVPDRPVEQGRRHTRIHPTTETKNDPPIAHLFPHILHRALQKRAHGPGSATSADLLQEITNDHLSTRRVGNLRVEL